MKHILIFSGTTEGNKIAERLRDAPVKMYISVATEYGKVCAGSYPNAEILTGRKNQKEIEHLIREKQISLVIDATHPYARIVTENVKAACEACGTEYIRCLREKDETEENEAVDTGRVVIVEDVNEAVHFLKDTEGNILITTGSKELKEYTEIPDYRNRCYARVLSTEQAVSDSCALGFEGKHLIAMQGPFSKEMNVATLRQIGADYFVTKESGKAGGFPEKLLAAEEAGVVLVVVGRPQEEGMEVREVLEYLDKIVG